MNQTTEQNTESPKLCRFIDSNYNDLFTVPDGGYVQIDRSDGETLIRKCKFLDVCHTHIGLNAYHICEFAERMEKNGSSYSPALNPEQVQGYLITDKTVVGKKVFVLAHNPNAVEPFVTWRGHVDYPGYESGNYFKERSAAHGDYIRRIYAERENRPYHPKKKTDHER